MAFHALLQMAPTVLRLNSAPLANSYYSSSPPFFYGDWQRSINSRNAKGNPDSKLIVSPDLGCINPSLAACSANSWGVFLLECRVVRRP